MNLKVQALLMQLESLTPLDYAMLSRDELRQLSDASFAVTGDAEIELEGRCGYARYVPELQGHH